MMEQRLKKVEEKEQISLDMMQHRAVIAAIKHGLLILTGGPGTGKTTTINTMIQFFEKEGMSVLLAAPTAVSYTHLGEGIYDVAFEGLIKNVERRYRETSSEAMKAEYETFMNITPCSACGGQRLKPGALAVLSLIHI